MQYILVIHNGHAPTSNASENAYFGPFDQEIAKAKLQEHVTNMGDDLYKIDESGKYAGYDYEDLLKANRDEDLASEVWAEISPLS